MNVSVSVNWDKSQIAAIETGPLKAALKRALRKAGATALRDMRSEASKRIRSRKRIKGSYISRALTLRRPKGAGHEVAGRLPTLGANNGVGKSTVSGRSRIVGA